MEISKESMGTRRSHWCVDNYLLGLYDIGTVSLKLPLTVDWEKRTNCKIRYLLHSWHMTQALWPWRMCCLATDVIIQPLLVPLLLPWPLPLKQGYGKEVVLNYQKLPFFFFQHNCSLCQAGSTQNNCVIRHSSFICLCCLHWNLLSLVIDHCFHVSAWDQEFDILF